MKKKLRKELRTKLESELNISLKVQNRKERRKEVNTKLKTKLKKNLKKELRRMEFGAQSADEAMYYEAPGMTRQARKEVRAEASMFFRTLRNQWPPVCDDWSLPGFSDGFREYSHAGDDNESDGEQRNEWAGEWEADEEHDGHDDDGLGTYEGWSDEEDGSGGGDPGVGWRGATDETEIEVYDVFGRPVRL